MNQVVADFALRLRKNITDLLRAGCDEDDMVKHLLGQLNLLEQTKPKFHQMHLIQEIKRTLGTQVSKYIDEQLVALVHTHVNSLPLLASNSNDSVMDLDVAFYNAVAAVTSTAGYLEIQQEWLQNVRNSVEQLVTELNAWNHNGVDCVPWDRLQEYINTQSDKQNDKQIQKDRDNRDNKDTTKGNNKDTIKGNNKGNNNDNNTDDFDRFSQFSFNTLPPYEKLPSICQHMTLNNNDQVRTTAYDSLLEFSPGDLLHSECWRSVQESITEALGDPIAELRSSYFGLLWRLYRDAEPVQTGELYMCLLQHLNNVAIKGRLNFKVEQKEQKEQQEQQEQQEQKGSNDWDWLRQIRLLNHLQRNMTTHMVYFPDNLLASVVVGTFNLFQWPAMSTTSTSRKSYTKSVGFGEMLSYCDPEALWFRAWFASARPRDQMLNYAWQSGLISHLIEQIREQRKDENNNQTNGKMRVKVQGHAMLHTLSMLSVMVQYTEARRALQCVVIPSSGDGGVSSAAVLPTLESIETCPLAATNNLVRVIVAGALWLNVEKDQCSSNENGGSLEEITLGWWQASRQPLPKDSALHEIYEYCSHLIGMLSNLSMLKNKASCTHYVLNNQSAIASRVLSAIITTSVVAVTNAANESNQSNLNSQVAWPFMLTDGLGAASIGNLVNVTQQYKASTTNGWKALSTIIAVLMENAVSNGLTALLVGETTGGSSRASLMLEEAFTCIETLLNVLLDRQQKKTGIDMDGEHGSALETILAEQLKGCVLPLLQSSLACQFLNNHSLYSLILRAASIQHWTTTTTKTTSSSTLDSVLHQCVVRMSLTSIGLRHLIKQCEQDNVVQQHVERWLHTLSQHSERRNGGCSGGGIHQTECVEILSNALLSSVLSKIIYKGTTFCWQGVQTCMEGDGDGEQDHNYIGDPMTMHHTHPEDMPTWIKDVVMTSKVLFSGPHAGMLIGEIDEANDKKKGTTSNGAVDASTRNVLTPRVIVENIVMVTNNNSSATVMGYNQDNTAMIGLDIVRSLSLCTATVLAAQRDIETALIELQRCSSIGHMQDIELKDLNELINMPGIEAVQTKPVATPTADATSTTNSLVHNDIVTCRDEVIIDAITIRRDELLSCLRGNLSFVSTLKATPTTTSGWSEPTSVQSLQIPSAVITHQVSPCEQQSSAKIVPLEWNTMFDSCRALSQEQRIHVLACTIKNLLLGIRHRNDNQPPKTNIVEKDQADDATLASSATSATSFVIARHAVRQGVEHLCLNSGDPISAVVTLSSLIHKVEEKRNKITHGTIGWYVSTLELIVGCARDDRTILIDSLVGDLVLPFSSFANQMFSFAFATNVSQQVDELLEGSGSRSVVRAALKMEGISLTFVVHRWLSQCFWNYLPFDVILVYLATRFETWHLTGKEDVAATACFIAAVFTHVVGQYIRNGAVRRPTVSLRDVLIDGPLPVSIGESLWSDRALWDNIESWRKKV